MIIVETGRGYFPKMTTRFSVSSKKWKEWKRSGQIPAQMKRNLSFNNGYTIVSPILSRGRSVEITPWECAVPMGKEKWKRLKSPFYSDFFNIFESMID